MRKKEKNIIIISFAVVVALMISFIFMQARVQIAPGKGFGRNTYTSKDSMLISDRHMGFVNFKLFSDLMIKVCGNDADIKTDKDSAYFKISRPQRVFGQNYKDEKSWIRQYGNLPITVTDNGFNACIEKIDSIEYVYIPYQLLSYIAKFTKDSNVKNEGVDSEPKQTLKKGNNLPASSMHGKIETEGIVRQNVVDILSRHPNLSQEKQIEVLWRYAKDNWNYMNDPHTTSDTWRPASDTINDYYFINGKCYTGDCDDFAILMASFARQIGFPVAIIAAYDNQGSGHAYAEYHNGKKWIPMDWFSNKIGGTPFNGQRIDVHRDPVN